MAVRREIRFLLNGDAVRLTACGPNDTLLDFLRLDRGLTGTKEGCAEGDCGACTVLVGRRDGKTMRYQPVNACIRLMPSVDLCHVVTVEHLSPPQGPLHPVQAAMVKHHASQCGFCTPGFVMTLAALGMETSKNDDTAIEQALQGNLCRCTGYGPIIAAAREAAGAGIETDGVVDRLAAMDDGVRLEVARGQARAILPRDVDDLADALTTEPKATIIAGATDVGLWLTKDMADLSPAVFIGHLRDLQAIEETDDALTFGAGVSYQDAWAPLVRLFPHLDRYWSRIGGWQVRAMGTIGGNIANGSPIGDTPPVLIALDAEITLRKGPDRRTLPLEGFFIDYGNQDRTPGEFVEAIRVPKPDPATLHAAYKISKRRDEDISSVAAGFAVTVKDSTVTAARLAFGGMAATPKRARAAEGALTGQPWTADTVSRAAEALTQDFSPLTDLRASAPYRMRAAQNLLRRFWLERTGETAALEDA